MTVGGDFYLNGGYYCIVTGNASSTLSVTGNATISGGTMILQEDNNPATIGTWNIGGDLTFSSGTITVISTGTGEIYIGDDFTFSGGTITEESTGRQEIYFNGGTTQTFDRTGGNIQNTINFSVTRRFHIGSWNKPYRWRWYFYA